jgi:HAD superfamily phosphoserine phosphatase-like hydrolase
MSVDAAVDVPFDSPLAWMPRFATVVFDVDSTLSTIEGIDWLAMRRSHDIARACATLTEQAMAGAVPLDAVYGQRLALIRPTAQEIALLGEAYLATMVPGMRSLIRLLLIKRVQVHLVSGGLRQALLPLARHLGIGEQQVHAVEVAADVDGTLSRLEGTQPLATQRGKPQTVHQLAAARPLVMIGDGSTDAAARGVVDTFIAFTGVVRRPAVVEVADAEAASVRALHRLLFEPDHAHDLFTAFSNDPAGGD